MLVNFIYRVHLTTAFADQSAVQIEKINLENIHPADTREKQH